MSWKSFLLVFEALCCASIGLVETSSRGSVIRDESNSPFCGLFLWEFIIGIIGLLPLATTQYAFNGLQIHTTASLDNIEEIFVTIMDPLLLR